MLEPELLVVARGSVVFVTAINDWAVRVHSTFLSITSVNYWAIGIYATALRWPATTVSTRTT